MFNKQYLLEINDKASEILEYAQCGFEEMYGTNCDGSIIIFNTYEYPFELSFDELVCKIDTILEGDIDEIYANLGEDFVNKYVDYVNNVITPIYTRLKNREW